MSLVPLALAELADRFFRLGAGEEVELPQAAAVDAGVDFEVEVSGPSSAPAPAPVPARPHPAVLIFDTETNGLRDPLAIQIAWIVYDADGEELWKHAEYLALPPGRRIDYAAQQIHGITMKILAEIGKVPQFVLMDFYADLDRVVARGGKVVAHNANFDARVVTNTARTCGLARGLDANECFCTMEQSKRRLGLQNRRGALKAPKNTELHEALVGPVPADLRLHDALADVRVTAASYFAGKRQRWW